MMYFISNDDASPEKPAAESKSTVKWEFAEITSSADEDVNSQRNLTSTENSNARKRVYGRARANLSFSSFYIFCEDFRQQLDLLFPHESETYRKDMLNYMWKHLNVRDKHKYYETATKARNLYNLPEYTNPSKNEQAKSTVRSTLSNSNNSTEFKNSCGSKVIGKLVSVKFSKSRTTPLITPLRETRISAATTKAQNNQCFEEFS